MPSHFPKVLHRSQRPSPCSFSIPPTLITFSSAPPPWRTVRWQGISRSTYARVPECHIGALWVGEVSLLRIDHGILDMPVQKMAPHRRPSRFFSLGIPLPGISTGLPWPLLKCLYLRHLNVCFSNIYLFSVQPLNNLNFNSFQFTTVDC